MEKTIFGYKIYFGSNSMIVEELEWKRHFRFLGKNLIVGKTLGICQDCNENTATNICLDYENEERRLCWGCQEGFYCPSCGNFYAGKTTFESTGYCHNCHSGMDHNEDDDYDPFLNDGIGF